MTQHSGSARHGPSRAGQAAQAGGFPSAGLSFAAPLTTSLVPSVAAGSNVPTYSRATAAYVQDHEGVQRLVLANEARFWGARRVYNQVPTNSQNPNSAGFTNGDVTVTVASGETNPHGGGSAYQVLEGSAGTAVLSMTPLAANANAITIAGSMTVKYGGTAPNPWVLLRIVDTTGFGNGRAWFNLQTGTVGSTATTVGVNTPTVVGTPAMAALGNGWYRLKLVVSFTAAAGSTYCVRYTSASADASNTRVSNSTTLFAAAQFEDVTGQSVQTVAEYVSVGITATPYQGANVDGVQYLDTVRLHTQNQITQSVDISNAAWTKTASSITGPFAAFDGSLTAWKLVDTVANTQHVFYQGGNAALPQGTPVTVEIDVKRADYRYAELQAKDQSFAQLFSVRIDFNNPTFAGLLASALGGPPTPTVYGITDLGGGWYRLSVTGVFTLSTPQVFIHPLLQNDIGANAFAGTGSSGTLFARPTLRGGTPSFLSTYVPTTTAAVGPTDTGTTAPIPATTLLGYLAEAAGTQLVTPTAAIRNMTDGSWTLGATMTRAFTSTGVDGVPTSATRLTAGAVAATNTITQTLVAAASSRTYSCYIRRVTGTGPVRLTQDNFTGGTDISGSLVPGQWVRVSFNAAILNAQFGIKIDTSGDAIDVDFNQFEAASAALNLSYTSPMATTGASRNTDNLSYVVAGNINGTLGSAYVEWQTSLVANNGAMIGSGGTVLGMGGANVDYSYDNTTFLNAAAGVAAFTSYKSAVSWGGGARSLVRGGSALQTGVFDGDFNLAGISPGSAPAASLIQRNLRIYSQKLTDAQLTAMVA